MHRHEFLICMQLCTVPIEYIILATCITIHKYSMHIGLHMRTYTDYNLRITATALPKDE